MLEAYGEALQFLFAPLNLLILLVCVIVGLIIGVVPGISGFFACTMVLVFIFKMPGNVPSTSTP